jgi:hypothetical protein
VVRYTVAGTPPKTRKPEADRKNAEKPEEKEKLDKDFAENMQRLEARVLLEQARSQWAYVLPGKMAAPLLMKREQMAVPGRRIAVIAAVGDPSYKLFLLSFLGLVEAGVILGHEAVDHCLFACCPVAHHAVRQSDQRRWNQQQTTGSSIRGRPKRAMRAERSFGAPPRPTQGGQVNLSKGATAVLVLDWRSPAPSGRQLVQQPRSAVNRFHPGISHTCSCYGWSPELLTPAPEPQ